MAENQTGAPNDLSHRAQRYIQTLIKKRPSLALAYLTVLVVAAMCAGMFWIEFENISLSLRELFPTLRDGTSDIDGASTLSFASIGAIGCGEVIMARASQSWSVRTHRIVDMAGLVALGLFAISIMVLLPTSTWQASDSSLDG